MFCKDIHGEQRLNSVTCSSIITTFTFVAVKDTFQQLFVSNPPQRKFSVTVIDSDTVI